jgi:hypothetical protein
VGAFLERMTGLRVANLARQGDCVFQQAYLLTEYIGMFRPRHVIYFFSENDIGDLSSSTTRRCASSSPLPSSRSVIRPGRNRPSLSGSARRSLLARPGARFVLCAEGGTLVPLALGVRPAHAGASARDPDDPASLAWQYTRKAIAYMRWPPGTGPSS